MKMLFRNATIVESGTMEVRDVLIEDGTIKEIARRISYAGDALDLSGMYLLPGVIDPHVHFREPGLTHKEDFLSGSIAAAAGGITTFLDMPNTVPPTTTVKLLEEKRKLARKSIVNYGFHFGAARDNIAEIKKARNIASVKVFFNLSTGALMISDDAVLKQVFSAARLVSVHAEGPMVEKAVSLTKECENELYLCHISSASELRFLRQHKTAGMYVEATPQHLFLNSQHDRDSFTKMKPGLKAPMDQESLLRELREGIIDTVGTDHAPHTADEKSRSDYPHGIPGCETMLPLLLNAVNERKLTLSRVVELCCHNPARIFRIKKKGHIRVGYDADLTVVDFGLSQTVDEKVLFTKCGWSAFSGWTIRGWPVMTIVNGHIVFDHGSIIEGTYGTEVEIDENATGC